MNRLCVMKFGGTCLASGEDRKISLRHCTRQLKKHDKLIVVVSAMGRKGDPYSTDTLLEMVSSPSKPEKACLMATGEVISATVMADMLRFEGVSARAVTGWNAGIRTDGRNCDSKLESIDREVLQTALEEHDCIVVAGFQGMGSNGMVSTLGRGGSDITAIALAAALDADEVLLYKKIESVFTADPDIVSGVISVERISYEDLSQLGWQGAEVVHPRASEIAGKAGVKINIMSHSTGKRVTEIEPFVIHSGKYITGVASGPDVTQYRIRKIDEATLHGFYSKAFRLVAEASVSMDMFSVFGSIAMFTVLCEESGTVSEVLSKNMIEFETVSPCSKVSIVGAGMHGIKGVMARFSSALDQAGIDMLQTVDSHATISALVMLDQRDCALRALHREFLEE
ncbi:MAG: ACT domain-containing protein [Candidatus Aegiribacteria sp.]|nr:ACT domain-containing protein [Candidatus Aegiribacteria sp.]